MNKNRIQGRHEATSWHNTAKSTGLLVEVNAEVMPGSSVFLPGETCLVPSRQESAEAIVAGPLPRWSTPVKGRTNGASSDRRQDTRASSTDRCRRGESLLDGKHGNFRTRLQIRASPLDHVVHAHWNRRIRPRTSGGVGPGSWLNPESTPGDPILLGCSWVSG